MTLVPSVMMDQTITVSSVGDLLEYYGEDLPSSSSLETELHLWKCKWSLSSQQLPDTPPDALQLASYNMFPNIHKIICLVCTILVTSCECERSVSVLCRLKTYLRSRMGQERLKACSHCTKIEPHSNWFETGSGQCAFNAHWSRSHCISRATEHLCSAYECRVTVMHALLFS